MVFCLFLLKPFNRSDTLYIFKYFFKIDSSIWNAFEYSVQNKKRLFFSNFPANNRIDGNICLTRFNRILHTYYDDGLSSSRSISTYLFLLIKANTFSKIWFLRNFVETAEAHLNQQNSKKCLTFIIIHLFHDTLIQKCFKYCFHSSIQLCRYVIYKAIQTIKHFAKHFDAIQKTQQRKVNEFFWMFFFAST